MMAAEKNMTLTMTDARELARSLEQHRTTALPAGPAWLEARRAEAMARFVALGLPTPRHEDWRWTNLGRDRSAGRQAAAPHTPTRAEVAKLSKPGLAALEIVFVNGAYAPHLSSRSAIPGGVIVTPFSEAGASESRALETHLGRYAPSDRAIPSLNTGAFVDGSFVHIGDDVSLEVPIHVLSLSVAGGPAVVSPRTLVLLGNRSRATLVETHASLSGHEVLVAPVTEIVCGAGSTLEHLRLIRESRYNQHVGTTAVQQETGSRYRGQVYPLSGGLVRNESHVRLSGEDADATLYGLYYGRDDQLVDNHTRLDHAAPSCRSWQVFKGILDGSSRGVFDGRILVRQIAQKTDAKQTSRNLLLSDDAVSNNKPQLEIYADDVKCTHGATTGQLDPEQIFYLRARGLSSEAARALLIFAFAREMVDGIPNEDVRSIVEEELLAKLPMGHVVQDLS
jgi:Fe-S cluster assembly protein SufD